MANQFPRNQIIPTWSKLSIKCKNSFFHHLPAANHSLNKENLHDFMILFFFFLTLETFETSQLNLPIYLICVHYSAFSHLAVLGVSVFLSKTRPSICALNLTQGWLNLSSTIISPFCLDLSIILQIRHDDFYLKHFFPQ